MNSMSTITNSNGKRKLVDEIGQFATIPFSFIEGSMELSFHARWLFVTLRYFTNGKTGNAFPSYDTIKKLTGMRREKISDSIVELEEAGWLKRQVRQGKSTIYTLVMPKPIATNRGGVNSDIAEREAEPQQKAARGHDEGEGEDRVVVMKKNYQTRKWESVG